VVTDLPDSSEPEPRPPTPHRGDMDVRVADAERDRAVTQLREHTVEGRLTLDEFTQRVGLALQARTQGDLHAAMADLPEVAVPQEVSTRRPARRSFVAVMSGSRAKGRWRVGAQTTAVAVMGGCEMDLRQAEIEGPEVVITAVAFWGGVHVIVPEGIDVQLEGFSFMGGRNLKVRDVPIVPGSPRIRVRGYAVMGGIDVRSRSRREVAQAVVEGVLGPEAFPPSLAGASSDPIDLAALGRDIRRQMRGQRAPAPTPPYSPPSGEETVTIVFSDMVNYAGMTEAMGDRISREMLQEHHRIVRDQVQRHGGREVKVQGDGFMMAFGGVARALRCAAEMQRAFHDYSLLHPDRPIEVHIGVHTGEALEEDDDFLGHTVIVASRLADVAEPGEIVVSSLSEQLVVRSGEFRFGHHREVSLKGLTTPQQAASLVWGD
jgi:class 3 adenylate cyclase